MFFVCFLPILKRKKCMYYYGSEKSTNKLAKILLKQTKYNNNMEWRGKHDTT